MRESQIYAGVDKQMRALLLTLHDFAPQDAALGPLGGVQGSIRTLYVYRDAEGALVCGAWSQHMTVRSPLSPSDDEMIRLGELEHLDAAELAPAEYALLGAAVRVHEAVIPMHDEIKRPAEAEKEGEEAA